MQNNNRQLHFFGNREVNSLYLTLGLINFGKSLITVFVPIYLWKLGFPLWQILFFYFLNSLFFVLLTFFLLPVLRRLSDKTAMLLSVPFLITYYIGLSFIPFNITSFYVLPIFLALQGIFFNLGYHLAFSGATNDKYIGREVGARNMIRTSFNFSAPFVGGVLIATFGFNYTFIVGSAILFLAILPLFFFSKRVFSPGLTRGAIINFLKNKSLRPFNVLGVAYATESMVSRIIWALFIFLSIGSIEVFGGVISLGLFVGLVLTYLAGFLSDIGRRRKVISWSTYLFSLVWATRGFLSGALAVVGSNILGNGLNSVRLVSWESQYYKIAKFIPSPDVFVLSREVLYNASRIIFFPILMLFSWLLPMNQFFIFSFILTAVLSLFYLSANKLRLDNLNIS